MPDAIVQQICLHARRPIIAGTGERRMTRQDMAQPELAALMRVSKVRAIPSKQGWWLICVKQFHNIAAPLLYGHIVTCDIIAIFSDMLSATTILGKRRPKLSPSKAWLLQLCRHLSLEGADSPQTGSDEYDAVRKAFFKKSPWLERGIGSGDSHVHKAFVDGYTAELEIILAHGGLGLFPNLETLTVCSFGSAYDSPKRAPLTCQPVWALQGAADRLIRSAPVQHRCFGNRSAFPFGWSTLVGMTDPGLPGDDAVTQYVHTTKTDFFRITKHAKTVYLYHDPPDRMSDLELEDLLDKIIEVAHGDRHGRTYEYENGMNPLDIEIRVPHSFCPEWNESAPGYQVRAGMVLRRRLEARPAKWVGDPGDRWKITVTHGVQECPVCEQPYGVEREEALPAYSWDD